MLMLARKPAAEQAPTPEMRTLAMIDYLRSVVLTPPAQHERGHAIFVDQGHIWVGDTAFGIGSLDTLSLRMRPLFAQALRLGATGLILAHSHPSGHCRPSGCDIAATRRLREVGLALDIVLVDHLIFTAEAVYSMRAGGLL
jgi:DNA repair protein RadC